MTNESDEYGGEAQHDELPDWVPEEYNPDAPLRERLPVMAEIEGGIELHVADDRGLVNVVGEPHELTEDAQGNYRLKAGGKEFNWNFEIVVPAEHPARLEKVNPDQEYEMYEKSRTTKLSDVDVRIYGVDADRFDEQEVTV